MSQHAQKRIFGQALVGEVVVALILAGSLVAVRLPVAYAAGRSLIVTNCSTYGTSDQAHTLAQAVALAATNDGSTIRFACSGIIRVPAPITVSNTLTMSGTVHHSVTLDGGHTTSDPGSGMQVFVVTSSGNLTLDGLTVAHGYSGTSGGGVLNISGTLTVTNSTFTGNVANLNGGGVFNFPARTLTITNSTFSGNRASGPGSGIYNLGAATITNSTISGNVTHDGGALLNAGGGTLTVTNSTISGNKADVRGGGIANASGTATITNSTISGNSAPDGSGGGVFNGGGTLTILNSIVARQSGGGNCVGGVTGGGYNLTDEDENASCGFNADKQHDVVSADPLLGPLADNGGPTQTMALLEGSPAIDKVPLAHQCPPTDQRGFRRPDFKKELACDIGAYESSFR